MRILFACALAALLTAQVPPIAAHYEIDLGQYFSSPQVELQSRAGVLASAASFAASATPVTAPALLRWLQRFDGLITALQRHDIYVYLRASEDDRDNADASADDTLGDADDLVSNRVVDAARQNSADRKSNA